MNIRIFSFLKRHSKKPEGRFADFLLNASPKEKMRIFTDAAKRVNEDQRETLRRANLKLKSN